MVVPKVRRGTWKVLRLRSKTDFSASGFICIYREFLGCTGICCLFIRFALSDSFGYAQWAAGFQQEVGVTDGKDEGSPTI